MSWGSGWLKNLAMRYFQAYKDKGIEPPLCEVSKGPVMPLKTVKLAYSEIIFAPYVTVLKDDIIKMSEIDQKKLEKGRQEYRDKMREYDRRHEVCPKCFSSNYISTYVGYIMYDLETYKDENSVECKCGWRGIKHDMVERSKNEKD